MEDLDRKFSSGEKAGKNLREEVEELQEKLSEENRAKIAASNKQKHLAVRGWGGEGVGR